VPELPEVETIVRALRSGGRGQPPLLGRQVRSAELLWGRTLAEPGADEFAQRIAGQTFQTSERRAKYLLLGLERDTLIVHLRMSGDLRVEADAGELEKHDRLALHLADGMRLVFNDARKFGRVWLAADPTSVLAGLGPEPFDPALDAQAFLAMLGRTQRPIKPLLLDQTFIAGIGNIYADEALHTAGIHPLAVASQIPALKAALLLDAIREVLQAGIERNGASFDWVYRGGEYQNQFRVYQRTGEPCPVCGSPIERRVIGQRSSHFCPVCQRF